MRRSSQSEEEQPQCGGGATVSRLATVRRRSHSEEEWPKCGGGATVRRSHREEEGPQCRGGAASVRRRSHMRSGLSLEEPR